MREDKKENACLIFSKKILSKQENTSSELELKLKKKGFDKETIRETLSLLEKDGYINDALFLKNYIDLVLLKENHGRTYILSKLLKKGIPYRTIEKELNRIFDYETELRIAQKILEKNIEFLEKNLLAKKNRIKNKQQKEINAALKQQKWRFLKYRGFSNRTIRKILSKDMI